MDIHYCKKGFYIKDKYYEYIVDLYEQENIHKLFTLVIDNDIEEIPDLLFEKDELVEKVIMKNVKKIGLQSFNSCPNLKEVIFNDDIELIESKAFEFCHQLHSVKLPKELKIIGRSVFRFCKNLNKIEFNNKLEHVYDFAFQGTNLTKIELPESLKYMEACIFSNCKKLQSIKIPNKCSIFWGGTFQECEKLEEVILPDNMKQIPCEMFKNCKSLTKINLPDTVEEIGSSAFKGCSALTEINLSHINKIIYKNAFSECKALKNVDIRHVTGIGDFAFHKCSSLEKLTFGENLNVIGVDAFFECNNLKKIIFTEEDFNQNTYDDICTLVRARYNPNFLTDIDINAFNYCEYLKENFLEEQDGFVINKLTNELVNIKKEDSFYIEIPEYITKIGSGVLENINFNVMKFKAKNIEIKSGNINKNCFALDFDSENITLGYLKFEDAPMNNISMVFLNNVKSFNGPRYVFPILIINCEKENFDEEIFKEYGMKIYINKNFNELLEDGYEIDQINQIIRGYKDNINLSIYKQDLSASELRTVINYLKTDEQMRYMYFDIISGINLSHSEDTKELAKYALDGFNEKMLTNEEIPRFNPKDIPTGLDEICF